MKLVVVKEHFSEGGEGGVGGGGAKGKRAAALTPSQALHQKCYKKNIVNVLRTYRFTNV